MALIKCPECGNNVSTAAATCPHCGYPMQHAHVGGNTCVIYGEPYDMTDVMQLLGEVKERGDEKWCLAYETCFDKYKKAIGVTELNAHNLCDIGRVFDKMEKTGKVPPEYPFPDTPRCPTCGSTDIRKLSAGARGVSLGLFGLASKTARSQFVCENCGYKW